MHSDGLCRLGTSGASSAAPHIPACSWAVHPRRACPHNCTCKNLSLWLFGSKLFSKSFHNFFASANADPCTLLCCCSSFARLLPTQPHGLSAIHWFGRSWASIHPFCIRTAWGLRQTHKVGFHARSTLLQRGLVVDRLNDLVPGGHRLSRLQQASCSLCLVRQVACSRHCSLPRSTWSIRASTRNRCGVLSALSLSSRYRLPFPAYEKACTSRRAWTFEPLEPLCCQCFFDMGTAPPKQKISLHPVLKNLVLTGFPLQTSSKANPQNKSYKPCKISWSCFCKRHGFTFVNCFTFLVSTATSEILSKMPLCWNCGKAKLKTRSLLSPSGVPARNMLRILWQTIQTENPERQTYSFIGSLSLTRACSGGRLQQRTYPLKMSIPLISWVPGVALWAGCSCTLGCSDTDWAFLSSNESPNV